ncbi:MAG: uroporphyrinogen decarboxylase [Leadbetterella sp.]
MELQNDLFLRTALGQKVERTPVWLMRQAGRILPEYRKVREQAGSFIKLATTPAMSAEVTIQPVDILGVDAAIIFSDILVIPEAMGLPYEMIESKGPNFPKVIQSSQDIEVLDDHNFITERLSYVTEAIDIVKKDLAGRVPLIGFAGAPFTIFCYMVEGHGSKTFSKAKKMLYSEPAMAHQLLQKITNATILYLKSQIEHGVDLVQIFDSWAGILSPIQYQTFSLPYIQQICSAIQNVPKTVFAKGAFFAREWFNTIDCQVVGLDWNMDISESKNLIPNKVLQGNLDPCVLFASFKEIEKYTKEMLDQFKGQNHIANLGHGVYPETDPEKVKCFIETVKAY